MSDRYFKSCIGGRGSNIWHFRCDVIFEWPLKDLCKYFENDRFRIDLISELGKINIEENEKGFNNFLDACERILEIHAPRKRKYVRGNHVRFMNRAVFKVVKQELDLETSS